MKLIKVGMFFLFAPGLGLWLLFTFSLIFDSKLQGFMYSVNSFAGLPLNIYAMRILVYIGLALTLIGGFMTSINEFKKLIQKTKSTR